MITTITQFVLHPDDQDALTDSDTTTVDLLDEGGGRFLAITQHDHHDAPRVITLEFEELEKLYNTAKLLWR